MAVWTNSREQAFVEGQMELFLALTMGERGATNLSDIPRIGGRDPIALAPVLIADQQCLTEEEVDGLRADYFGDHGVAYFIVTSPHGTCNRHPLLPLAQQLSNALPLAYPVDHPMERHPEAIKRFGQPDGTLKIYDLETRNGRHGYREQAETAEMFDAHNDGLGYGGSVESVILYADSGPVFGGFTYFQNVVHLALELARDDKDAFASLFLPDSISALRPRGKGAIKVTSPVLFVNEFRRPQCFLRVSTGEYKIKWRADHEPLGRAAMFMKRHAQPFAPGSSFVHLDRRGAGVIIRNERVVHGRTPFIDSAEGEDRRVLARKWFMSAGHHAQYKHVPGMNVWTEHAHLFPEFFGSEVLSGDWNFHPEVGKNVRKG